MRDRSSDSTLVKVVTPQLSSGPLGRRNNQIVKRLMSLNSIFSSIAVSMVSIIFGAACKESPTPVEVQKPDLIITQATAARAAYGGYQITAHIANIGETSVNQPFHMWSSVYYSDFVQRQVSYGQMVNDPPQTLSAGGSIDVQFTLTPHDTTSFAFVVVNADGRYNSKIPAANIDESDYDNNSYNVKLR